MREPTAAESVERRASAERNSEASGESGPQRPEGSDSGLSRIRAAARKDRRVRFNNLLHHLTPGLLWSAYEGRYLGSVIRGALQYYGVPGNRQALEAFRTEICKSWLRALRRRSQKARKLNWEKFKRLVRQSSIRIRVSDCASDSTQEPSA